MATGTIMAREERKMAREAKFSRDAKREKAKGYASRKQIREER